MQAQPTTPNSVRPDLARQPSSSLMYRGRAGSSETVNSISDVDYLRTGASRAGSIYSLSRVSFAGQIAQLTSIKLPDATSLAKKISSIPTSSEAARTLFDASEQIKLWIGKASEVLQGLNADDDVEWAAAGGREGIEEVDQAISRFEKLVDVYVLSIERLQTREDVASLSAEELNGSVLQMEAIITSWANIKATLKSVKAQVQLAMDWEVLWNTDLGEIAQDLGELSRHIFEMEEKRHHGTDRFLGVRDSIDLNDLESILEEEPGAVLQGDNMRSPLTTVDSPLPKIKSAIDHTEALSLELSARMQPLRTSLDFLPIKLSTFRTRASTSFPTACQELEDRRDDLEAQWSRIESDAKSLRNELGEDKWMTVFKNAGNQASKMCESIERSHDKLKKALDTNEQVLNRSSFTRKLESYEAKRLHYAPAIDRVLAIIDKGVQERLTINGDILRHQNALRRKWLELQSSMKVLNGLLTELNMDKGEKQLRDSVSTILSSERSMLSSLLDTPGTSPAGSIIDSSRKSSQHGSRTPTQVTNSTLGLSGKATPSTASRRRTSAGRLSTSSLPRKPGGLFSRSSVADLRGSPSPGPDSSPASGPQWPSRSAIKDDGRPKWNSSIKAVKKDFEPLSKFEPSPYAKRSAAFRIAPREQPSRATTGATRVVSAPSQQDQPRIRSREQHKSTSMLTPATPDSRPSSALGNSNKPDRSFRRSLIGMHSARQSRSGNIDNASTDGNEMTSDLPTRENHRSVSSMDKAFRRTSILALRTKPDQEQVIAGAQRPKWR